MKISELNAALVVIEASRESMGSRELKISTGKRGVPMSANARRLLAERMKEQWASGQQGNQQTVMNQLWAEETYRESISRKCSIAQKKVWTEEYKEWRKRSGTWGQPRLKFTEEQKMNIREALTWMRATGASAPKTSKKFGVNVGKLRMYLKGQNLKDLE